MSKRKIKLQFYLCNDIIFIWVHINKNVLNKKRVRSDLYEKERNCRANGNYNGSIRMEWNAIAK